MPLSRRELLAAGAAGAATFTLPLPAGHARRIKRPLARAGAFPSGVVSGEPGRRSIVLGAQVDGLERTSRLLVEVARDPDFRHVVHRQGALATAEHGFHVKTRVSRRLKPGEEYFYRFATRTTSSPVGRFRTARPADSREPLRVGFFSCQLWTNGFYAAHRGLAQEDCDLVVCLGDYIYETNGEGVRADRTSPGENGQCELLGEYRDKYRLYRSDPDLQAMHASAAFLSTWDDHEVEDNHAGDDAGTTGARRIPYARRRENAYQAFFEVMPMVRHGAEADRVYRRLRLGGMVDLFLLDLRQYRDDQACDDTPAVPCPEASDPVRTLMGAEQKAWLKRELEASPAAWKVLGSSVEMMSWDTVPGLPANPDGWDGYQAERRELLGHVRDRNIKDVTVITGDIHTFVAGEVSPSGRWTEPAVATEFVGGAITSEFVDQAVANENARTNPHWKFVEFTRRGYGVLEARPDELRVEFKGPRDARDPAGPVEPIARFRVPKGTAAVETA
jgi:alkaline phosphatase D